MTAILKLEEAGLFLLSIFLFSQLTLSWWLFPLFLLAPDIAMIGYLINNKWGAIFYNIAHHKGLGIIIYIAGIYLSAEYLAFAGIIILGHASMDRIFGYGLKYQDSFQHTHLGWIGKNIKS